MADLAFHDHSQIKPNTARGKDDDKRSEHMSVAALAQIFCPWRHKGAKYEVQENSKKSAVSKKDTLRLLFNLVRRLAIFAASLVYISVSFRAAYATMALLRAEPTPEVDMSFFSSRLIAPWVGTGSIRWSPVVMFGLSNGTNPINETIYLDGANLSYTGCSPVPGMTPYPAALYGNPYVREIATKLFSDTAYNLTFFKDMELVAPVVDCYFDGLLIGSQTVIRVYYVLRAKSNPEDVALLSFAMSMQDYSIPQQNVKGPSGIANIALVRNMAPGSRVEHYYVAALTYPYAPLKFQVYTYLGLTKDHELRLLSIPPDRMLETPKEVLTSSRTGFYMNVETQQTNFRNAHPITEEDPTLVLTRWRFQGGPVMRDTWAWVHYIHALFALDTLLNMVILFVVVYRNLVRGRIWVGDAFSSVSNSLVHRGGLVILTWAVNQGWTLMEFCYQHANDISKFMTFYNQTTIIHADLLTVFLSLASLVGYLFRERIDPALVVLLFEIGFNYRVEIGNAIPVSKDGMILFSLLDLILGQLAMEPVYAQTTPIRFWTVHELSSKSVVFIVLALLPIFCFIGVIVLYAILRKIYRRFVPETLHILKVSDYSEKTDELKGLKRSLTLFEVATGAALQNRVGLASDYENCVFVKGVKYASADGIYCSGYVIVNGKFLVATADLLAIMIIKATRVRFKSVYVYEVNGKTVQQTARLLYAHTISWGDLARLNIGMLA